MEFLLGFGVEYVARGAESSVEPERTIMRSVEW